MSGVTDVFQLHTLLGAALIGRGDGSWLEGERPSEEAIACAKDNGPQETGLTTTPGPVLVAGPVL